MKQMFFWAIVIALTVSGCTQTDSIDVQKNNPIAFTPSIGKLTRGNTSFPENNSFNVTAYYKTATGEFNYSDAGSYFKNLNVTFTGGAWKGATTYYWPLDGYLKFVAYSPKDVATIGYSKATGVSLTDFTQDANGSIDLMYASTDSMKIATDPSPNPVGLTFNHALTMLNFTLKTNLIGMQFKVKQMVIKNLYNTGTFAVLPLPTWTVSGENTTNYTVYDNPDGVEIYKGADYVSNGHGTLGSNDYCYKFNTSLYVIPQTITSIQLYIKYDLIILGLLDKADVVKTITLTGDPWACNQHVEYAMSIGNTGLTEITYTPVITDWGSESELPSPF